jgi:hypothetical protein
MDGQYQSEVYNFTLSQKATISKWIIDSIEGESWKEGNDLHIDEILYPEIPENVWITVSFSLITFVDEELSRLGYTSIIPIIFIPLYGDEDERGVNFNSVLEVSSQFDVTPPSLFICPINWEGFIEAYSNRKRIGDIKFLDNLIYIYYHEELNSSGLEYVRNISILHNKHTKFLKDNE